ncbi:tail fiber assembly protein [Erwinia amylovora]|uniref:tail fiber assembly protein n=1 Tax=Erwinia amylovora TaxID=552 RepID=UPI001444880A|nr:tail fiber assembly protein [Erwinia amylovora]
MKLVNLQRYVPDEYFAGEGFQYFKDATGKDWYKALPGFTKKYSLAIENETGIIRSISEDASRLYPVGLTVVDVDSVPCGCDIFGGWVFDGERIVSRTYTTEELQAQTEAQKSRLAEVAKDRIDVLSYAVELGIASNAEKEILKKWKMYRVLLDRVQSDGAPDINWPVIPDVA